MAETRAEQLIAASEALRMRAERLQAGVIGSIERFRELRRESRYLRERAMREKRRRLGGWWDDINEFK